MDKVGDLHKVGEKLQAKIILLDEAKKNIKLSIKQLSEDPWLSAAEKFHVGDDVEGLVTKVLNYGAFVEIAEGVEGLVHITDFSWTKKK